MASRPLALAWSVWAVVTALALPACRRVDDAPPPPRDVTAEHPPATDPTAQREGPTAAERAPRTVVVPDFSAVVEKLGPSVVSVISTVPGQEQGARPLRGLGSGMIVTVGGQVLTNEHVVARASRVDVELASGQHLAAKVVHADPLLDLALLRIEHPPPDLPPVELRDDEPAPGTWVMALGQPFGLGQTVTVGVVSGLGRTWGDLGRPSSLRKDGLWSFIQTDASVNIGNSGGPLADAAGVVVGVTTAVRTDGQGLAFAIPTPMVRHFLDEVWTHGYVRHARLGVRAEDAYGVLPARASVVRVTRVEAGGPGAKAGLEAGDLVLAMDGAPIRHVAELAYRTQLRGVGSRVTLTIKRGKTPPRQILIIPAQARG